MALKAVEEADRRSHPELLKRFEQNYDKAHERGSNLSNIPSSSNDDPECVYCLSGERKRSEIQAVSSFTVLRRLCLIDCESSDSQFVSVLSKTGVRVLLRFRKRLQAKNDHSI